MFAKLMFVSKVRVLSKNDMLECSFPLMTRDTMYLPGVASGRTGCLKEAVSLVRTLPPMSRGSPLALCEIHRRTTVSFALKHGPFTVRSCEANAEPIDALRVNALLFLVSSSKSKNLYFVKSLLLVLLWSLISNH